MMLSFKFFNNPITFLNEEIPVIVIENKRLFRKIIDSFENDFSEEYFIFSESFNPIDFSKAGIFFSDIFNVDFNNKKLLSRATKYLAENANVELSCEIEQLISDLISFGDKLCELTDFDCEFNYDISTADIIKLLQFKLGSEEKSHTDRLISFILLMNKYLKIHLFVIPNLHILFEAHELSLVYETLLINHIKLISIECVEPPNRNSKERFCIVDKDLCFIDNLEI